MTNPPDLLFSFAAHSPHICFIYNRTQDVIVYGNPSFHTFFNFQMEKVSGKLLYEIVHTEDRNFLENILNSLESGVFKDKIEFRINKSNGQAHTMRLSVLLEKSSNQEQLITGYLEDITAATVHEEFLNEIANKKNAILNILSHDLAGPLGSIKNFTYLLTRKTFGNEDSQVKKMISSIEDISVRCIKLIQDFIKLEFLESVGVDIIKVRVNLVEVLQKFMQQTLILKVRQKRSFISPVAIPRSMHKLTKISLCRLSII